MEKEPDRSAVRKEMMFCFGKNHRRGISNKMYFICILLVWTQISVLSVGMLTGCSQNRNDRNVPVEEPTAETALRGQNEDPDSNLGAWGRAMGSVLISMNDGSPYYFGGYDTTEANEKAAQNILEQSWNIKNRKQLLKEIKWLTETGSRADYRKEAKEMASLSTKQLKKAMSQLSGSLLIHYEAVRYNWETWQGRGLLAWDLCRVSHLAQWGYIAGYINVSEAQALLEPAARKLQKKFDGWDDVITNWLDGYALSAAVDRDAADNDYEKRQEIYRTLQEEQKEKGALYDEALFQEEILPLQEASYQEMMEELKSKETKGNPKPKNGR